MVLCCRGLQRRIRRVRHSHAQLLQPSATNTCKPVRGDNAVSEKHPQKIRNTAGVGGAGGTSRGVRLLSRSARGRSERRRSASSPRRNRRARRSSAKGTPSAPSSPGRPPSKPRTLITVVCSCEGSFDGISDSKAEERKKERGEDAVGPCQRVRTRGPGKQKKQYQYCCCRHAAVVRCTVLRSMHAAFEKVSTDNFTAEEYEPCELVRIASSHEREGKCNLPPNPPPLPDLCLEASTCGQE